MYKPEVAYSRLQGVTLWTPELNLHYYTATETRVVRQIQESDWVCPSLSRLRITTLGPISVIVSPRRCKKLLQRWYQSLVLKQKSREKVSQRAYRSLAVVTFQLIVWEIFFIKPL